MANFSFGTFAKMVLDRVQQKSLLLPTVNTVADISATGGDIGDSLRVYQSPLSNVVVRKYVDTPVGTPRPDFTFDRLNRNFVSVTLDEFIYAGFVANGLDTIDFAEEQGRNYSTFVAQCADMIAAQIDTELSQAANALTATTATVTQTDPSTKALATLGVVEDAIDGVTDSGVTDALVVQASSAVIRALNPILESYSYTGDSDNVALRQGIVGAIHGSAVIRNPKIAANSFVVYSKDAFVAAFRATGKSSGAKASETVRTNFLALTANLAFDPSKQQDVVAVSAVGKVGLLDATRAKKVTVTFS